MNALAWLWAGAAAEIRAAGSRQ